MGMVVIHPYILVSKLKKTKTKFLRCTGYLNSTKIVSEYDKEIPQSHRQPHAPQGRATQPSRDPRKTN